MENIFTKDGEVNILGENEVALSVVNKIITTLPPYSLKEFIYLLSLTISNERTGRLDALYGALELVDYDTRVEMLVLFKEFGIEEELLKEMVSYFNDTSSSHNKVKSTGHRGLWVNKDTQAETHDHSNFYLKNQSHNLNMSGYEDMYSMNTKKLINPESPLSDRRSMRDLRHRSMNDAIWKSNRNDASFAMDLSNIVSESKDDMYISSRRREKCKKGHGSRKYAKKTRFTNEESKFIVSLVESSEITNWTVISKACNARFGGNKTGPQCHQHYFRVANSNISKNAWRQDEDELLKRLVQIHGYKWSQISQSLPGRPDTSCRRRWKTIQKNKTMMVAKDPIYAKLLDDNGKYMIHVTSHTFHIFIQQIADDDLVDQTPTFHKETDLNITFYSQKRMHEDSEKALKVATIQYNSKSKHFEMRVLHDDVTIKINNKIESSNNAKKLNHGDLIGVNGYSFHFIKIVHTETIHGLSYRVEESGPKLRSASFKAEQEKSMVPEFAEDYDSEMEMYMSDLCYLDDSESNIMEGGTMRKYKSSESMYIMSNTHHKRLSNQTYYPSQLEYPVLNLLSSNDSKNKQRKRALTDDEIKRDDQGRPILPLTFGGIILESLGEIVWDKDKFHSKRYIFPVGYTSKRSYFSLKDPSTRCWYKQEILENLNPISTAKNPHPDSSEPLFRLTCEDLPDEPIDGPTPSGVWAEVLERVRPVREEITGKKLFTTVSGPEQYGLSHKIIHRLINELPNASKCTKYDSSLAESTSNQPVKPKRRKKESDISEGDEDI